MSTSSRRLVRSVTSKKGNTASPLQVSGLKLWLKADTITGTANGANLASWTDMSGAGAHATNTTTAQQPVYVAGVANNLPIVRFNGSNGLRSVASSSDGNQTIVAVVRPSSVTGLKTITGSSANGGMQFRLTDSAIQLLSQGVGQIAFCGSVSAAAFQVITVTVTAGSSYAAWVNTASAGSGTTTQTLAAGLTTIIGSNGGSEGFIGDIAEIASYDRILSTTEIDAIIQSLMTKWVGTIAASAPGAATNVAVQYASGSTTATLTYAAPASNGGSPITGYIVARDDGGTGSGPVSATVGPAVLSYDFAGLQIGSTYTLSVSAVNAVGSGPAVTRQVAVTAASAVVDAIISDSFGSHDAVPRGVPGGYDWQYGATTDPNNSYTGYTGYGAVNTWGQVFAPTTNSGNYNVRLQCRDPRIWFLRTNGWEAGVIPSGSPGAMGGAYWAGDFNPDASQPATKRDEGSGVWSVSMQALSVGPPDAFHYWWDGMNPRIAIPSDCRGMVVRTDMRLVPGDSYSTISGANFIGSIDFDLFATQTTNIGPGNMNPGGPQARMKWVTGTWTRFYNTTLSIAALRAEPPPDN